MGGGRGREEGGREGGTGREGGRERKLLHLAQNNLVEGLRVGILDTEAQTQTHTLMDASVEKPHWSSLSVMLRCSLRLM
jgi:hypothetical protein